MGAILGALVGRHLANQENARRTSQEMVLTPVFDKLNNPATSKYTWDDAESNLDTAGQLNYLDKHHFAILKSKFAKARQQAEAAQNLQTHQEATAPKENGGLGVPNMNPGASQVAPGPPSGQLPTPPDQGGNAVQQEQVKSAILQRLMPAILAAQQQGGAPAGGAPTQAPVAAKPALQQAGMPRPPGFTDGTGAGPVPAQNQPAPQPASQPGPQQNPATALMKAGSIAGGTGFGGPSPAPMPATPVPPRPVANELVKNTGPRMFPVRGETLDDMAMRDAHAKVMGESISTPASAQLAREKAQLDFEAETQRLRAQPGFTDLTPRQQFSAITGKNITPELAPRSIPGLVQGKNEPAGTVDVYGHPLDPDTFYSRKEDYQGIKHYPAVGVTHVAIVPDANSTTGYSQVSLDRAQHEIGRETGVLPNPALLPTTSTDQSQGGQWIQVGNEVKWMPTSRTDTRTLEKQIPGGGPTPPAGTSGVRPNGPTTIPSASLAGSATAPSAAAPSASAPNLARPSRPTAPAAPTPRITQVKPGTVAGQTPAAWKMGVEQPYTEAGSKAMAELEPRMNMVQRILKLLEPTKNEDIPAADFFKTLKYRIGFAGSDADFLSQINLGSIGQAASVVKGTSRARSILDDARIHTPNTWNNSHKLMYQKLTEIYRNMQDMKKAIDTYEVKYPGLSGAKGSNLPTPPITDAAGLLKSIGH